MARQTYTWCSIKTFTLPPATLPAREVIEAVTVHPEYRDSYLGGGPEYQGYPAVHGPYLLSAISWQAYVPMTADDVKDELCEWARHPDIDADAREESVQILRREVFPIVAAGSSWFRLDLPRAGNEHESAWCLGGNGFHEFVVINRDLAQVRLLTASDD